MIISKDLFQKVVRRPLSRGFDSFKVISGYSSPGFLTYVLKESNNLKIDLILGMVKSQPITVWEHREYIRLMRKNKRLKVLYFIGEPPIHQKVYLWGKSNSSDREAYLGSADFSYRGFFDFQETLIKVNPEMVLDLFPSGSQVVHPTSDEAQKEIKFIENLEKLLNGFGFWLNGFESENCVELPLTSVRNTNLVPKRSGLNWGQRENREPNQAYIPIPQKIHRNKPNFFPERGKDFLVITDDADTFTAVIAQDGSKAIETSFDNSILGKYFRKRLGLKPGELVKMEHLEKYGRKTVKLCRLNQDIYFLDFKGAK